MFKRPMLLLFCVFPLGLLASDHKEAPLTREDPSADISDLYAFLNPHDASKLTLVLTVNPFSVPSEGVGFRFSPNVRYRLLIDNNGDAVEDHEITVRFDADENFEAKLPGEIIVTGKATAPTEEPEANEALIFGEDQGVRIFAGPRDDPFFFDIVGFFRFLAGTGGFTGTDGFAGYNVSAIVVEIPVSLVKGSGNILNTWAVTERPKAGGQLFKGPTVYSGWEPVDRVGNPAVATALIPPGLKDVYNRTAPNRDAELYVPSIVDSLTALGTNSENIGILASVAVPDLLTIDVSAPSGFPNGRTPSDDVVDTLFYFIFNQTEVPDGVATNDVAFLDAFPYLAPPHQPE